MFSILCMCVCEFACKQDNTKTNSLIETFMGLMALGHRQMDQIVE